MHRLLVFICAIALSRCQNQTYHHENRAFSIFSVVQFPNSECTTATDAYRGVCQSSSDCASSSGTADGSCASGFGVCCAYKKSECGSTISTNVTYVTNPGYPSSFTGATGKTTCSYTISLSSDICQLRLDFENLVLAQPSTVTATSGSCNVDTFAVTGPTGLNPPTLCGTLTGQHIYVETGAVDGSATATFAMDFTTSSTRKYRIKISKLACISPDKAPTDCTQYFTGTTGTFTSFNYGNLMLQSQDYSTCFRRGDGHCAIRYKATPGQTFYLQMANSNTVPTMGFFSGCLQSFVFIPNGNGGAALCGIFLNPGVLGTSAAQLMPGSVLSSESFFNVRTMVCACSQFGATGYSIDFEQIGCSGGVVLGN